MDLEEQAEREIAEKLGFLVWGVNGQHRIAGICDSSCGEVASPTEIKLWQALVRDRCSLLKLRKAAAIVCQASIEDPAIVALRSALEGK